MAAIRQSRVDAAVERLLGLTRAEIKAFGAQLRISDPGLVQSLGAALGLVRPERDAGTPREFTYPQAAEETEDDDF